MIKRKTKNEKLEEEMFKIKYGVSSLGIEDRKERTLDSTFVDIHLVQIVKDGSIIGYRMFSDKDLLKCSDEYIFHKLKNFSVVKPLTVYLALEILFSKKLITLSLDGKNVIALKLAPIDLKFFNDLESIPFTPSVNSLYEVLNGKRKKFIESRRAI